MKSEIPIGPESYENWKSLLDNKPMRVGVEYPLFTDALIMGELSTGCGPYSVINLVAWGNAGNIRPALVLRVDIHLVEGDHLTSTKTDVGSYHGGGISDEIAALCSLCFGFRLKPGGMSRRFSKKDGPKGRPVGWNPWNPSCPPMFANSERRFPRLPRLRGEHKLHFSPIISILPFLAPEEATVLVRTARYYQDAVWYSETYPEFTWLMLVSAVETAAQHWDSSKAEPVERVRDAKPELVEYLETFHDRVLLDRVTKMIADCVGSGKKFREFILEFMPGPPSERKNRAVQISWEKHEMEGYLKKIYGWRSRMLHSGIPIPFPMCEPPLQGFGHMEKPMGLATRCEGGTWNIEDTPMLLDTFEYLVRGSLLNWCERALINGKMSHRELATAAEIRGQR